MNKREIINRIIQQLEADLLILEQAVKLARDTATHGDCLGSSKYETMGLEASYLAQGQGTRLLEVQRSLEYFRRLSMTESTDVVGLSSLVKLEDEQGVQQLLWLAAEAGGLKIEYESQVITVITPRSPLGRILIGKTVDECFDIVIAGNQRSYDIVAVT